MWAKLQGRTFHNADFLFNTFIIQNGNSPYIRKIKT